MSAKAMNASKSMSLNPWDVQSKHVVTIDGTCEALCAGEKRWGSLPPNVLYEATRGMIEKECYAIDGNVVDRSAMQNGKGWCENVSPTLNTQDRHAVVFAINDSEVEDEKGNC